MRCLVTYALTLVTAITICVLAEPTDVIKPRVPVSRVPVPPPPGLQHHQASSDGDKPSFFSSLDIYFSPYRLLNIDRAYYPKPNPQNYMYKPETLWVSKEIERLNRMRAKQGQNSIDKVLQYPQRTYTPQEFEANMEMAYDYESSIEAMPNAEKPADQKPGNGFEKAVKKTSNKPVNKAWEKRQMEFASTPLNKEFYVVGPTGDYTAEVAEEGGMHFMIRRRNGNQAPVADTDFEDLRQQRQNPNKAKTTALEEELPSVIKSTLRSQIPLSLVPIKLQRLKLLQRTQAEKHRARASLAVGAGVEAVPDMSEEPSNSLYFIAIFTAMGAALSLAIIGIALGWYTKPALTIQPRLMVAIDGEVGDRDEEMKKRHRAKAAADVDYPAYGVTGPSADNNGDRRLAHSAHMYHYQHQKQQIIAMERGGTEQRNGSISDPESEDDNEEGDYTVYECPGYATTGDMEVKNPLFSDDPTPATPAVVAATPAVDAATTATKDSATATAPAHSPIIVVNTE